MPGFGLTMGFTLFYLSAIVLIPIGGIILKTLGIPWSEFWRLATTERALAAYELTFGASLIAALANAVFGTLLAWVLTRYEFPGRRFVDAMVDFPFALPTAVAGLTLANLFAANGWLGQYLVPLGIKGAYTPLGIVIALTFVGMPFVVRTLQPVIENFEREVEESAATLGAGRLRTFLERDRPVAAAVHHHRFCAGLRPGDWRIRLDCFHLGQPAVQDRDCAVSDRDAAGGIRLRRGDDAWRWCC